MHAEPSWLSELRQTAFEAMTELEMPNIERVKFNRWGLDNTEIGDSEPSGNVPSFTEWNKCVQIWLKKVLFSLILPQQWKKFLR